MEKVSEKKPGSRKNWWEVSALLTPSQTNTVLLSAAGAIVLLLILLIVSVARSSHRAGTINTLSESLAQTEAQLQAATSLPAEPGVKLEPEPKPIVIAEDANIDELRAKAKELNASLARMSKERQQLKASADSLTKVNAALSQEAQRSANDLRATNEEVKSLKKKADEGDSATKKIESLTKSLKDARDELNTRNADFKKNEVDMARAKKDIETLSRDSEAAAVKYKAELAERDKRIAELDEKLSEFPKTPLMDVQAELKYNEVVEKGKVITSRDERIAYYFRAIMALAGTRYEAKAKTLWDNEKRAKEQAQDRVSSDVYKQVTAQVRARPDAHAENIKLLEDALQQVLGTKYEEPIQKMLDKERTAQSSAPGKAPATPPAKAPVG